MPKKKKCWKKTKIAGVTIFDNKKSKDKVMVSKFEGGGYQAHIFRIRKMPISKFTNSKKKADSFAEDYMEKHGVC